MGPVFLFMQNRLYNIVRIFANHYERCMHSILIFCRHLLYMQQLEVWLLSVFTSQYADMNISRGMMIAKLGTVKCMDT